MVYVKIQYAVQMSSLLLELDVVSSLAITLRRTWASSVNAKERDGDTDAFVRSVPLQPRA